MWEFWRSSSAKGRRGRGDSPEHSGDLECTMDGAMACDPLWSGHTTPVSPKKSPSKGGERTHVDFMDLRIPLNDTDEEEQGEYHGAQMRRKMVEKHKLIIVLVGLPGRGKTFLCNKLCCYLNWLGHKTQHFNVGFYRRKQNKTKETQDASFFDKNNKEGQEKRQQALLEALKSMTKWLEQESSQVAIFDATNSTEERRRFLISKFHGQFQYLFLESVCNDPEVLEANYRYKMMYSPDYQGVEMEQALDDFKERIRRYEEVYETIDDRNVHYIKLINMVTGRGHLDINRISGYLPGKIVFYLMQICKVGMARTRKIWLSRHGESEYNTRELLGGDSDLSRQGEDYAEQLPNIIFDRLPLSFEESPVLVSVWTSTLKRSIQTAEFLPFPKLRWKALDEIHAGIFDSYTYKQIAEKYPEEFAARKANKLTYRYPNGESYLDVIQRLEPVIIELEREKESVLIVAHQAILRAIYGYFTNKPLGDIPTLEIPLHTVIELTPKADGTMTEERFFTGIPTTSKLYEMAAARYSAHDRLPRPPAAQTDQDPPQNLCGTEGGRQRPLGTSAPGPVSLRSGSPSPQPKRLLRPGSEDGFGSSHNHNHSLARSLSEMHLQRPSYIPVLSHSMMSGSGRASDWDADDPSAVTSDEGPGGPMGWMAGPSIEPRDLNESM